MPEYHDRWGEPIPASRSTFSLATVLRVVTAVCLGFGWCSIVRLNPETAGSMLSVISLALAAVVAWRQRGSVWTKIAIGTAYFLGVGFVGIYVASLSVALFPPPWLKDDHGLFPLAGTCLGLVALPLVTIVVAALLKAWLHVAADAADRS